LYSGIVFLSAFVCEFEVLRASILFDFTEAVSVLKETFYSFGLEDTECPLLKEPGLPFISLSRCVFSRNAIPLNECEFI
jgi:hypothetical protein